MLRADLLRPLAHWITPENEKRRYDTKFFLAALPSGQLADDHTTEVEQAVWRPAAAALTEWSAGQCFLLPPTWAQLRTVAAAGSVAELLDRDVTIETVLPEVTGPGGIEALRFDDAEAYFASMPDSLKQPS